MSTDLSTVEVRFPTDRLLEYLRSTDDIVEAGRVSRVVGLTVEASGPRAVVGDLCAIERPGTEPLLAEVVGFRDDRLLLTPLGDVTGIGPGSRVVARRRPLMIPVGEPLIGRVIDYRGRPLDGRGPVHGETMAPLWQPAPSPMERERIDKPFSVGVRAIDALITCGLGQRTGLFAGSGVGKSTLLGMMARFAKADVVCIGLVGERGREVREFLERDLGEEGLSRSVVVVATSDRPPLERIKAALAVTTVAEYFRDQGLNVLLLMDSVTRFANAQREVGLSAGEPPTTRGYPPSVFSLLPRLLERAGPGSRGTITAFYTVLVDGDDMLEPIADACRSILDGHIVLSRRLAEANHYPAIDVLASASRVMADVVSPQHLEAAGRIRTLMARYRESADLVRIGAYVAGTDPLLDAALEAWPRIESFLRQHVTEAAALDDAAAALAALLPDSMALPWQRREDGKSA